MGNEIEDFVPNIWMGPAFHWLCKKIITFLFIYKKKKKIFDKDSFVLGIWMIVCVCPFKFYEIFISYLSNKKNSMKYFMESFPIPFFDVQIRKI